MGERSGDVRQRLQSDEDEEEPERRLGQHDREHYRYRARPPGSESRFDWIVQVRGDGALLDGVELVTWQMDPPPTSEGELMSRDRARDGFPLFGYGPGGWFRVSATVRFKDGGTETLGRRVELPE